MPLYPPDLSAGWGTLIFGRYYFPVGGGSLGLSTSAAVGTGTLRVAPWFAPIAVTLSAIGAEVTVIGDAGSKVRLGVYADNGSGAPGNLLLDAGQIAGDSATVQDIATNLTLAAGLYWIGGAVQSVTVTQPTLRITTAAPAVPIAASTSLPTAGLSAMGYSQSSVTGALPAVFTSPPGPVATLLRVHVKVL